MDHTPYFRPIYGVWSRGDLGGGPYFTLISGVLGLAMYARDPIAFKTRLVDVFPAHMSAKKAKSCINTDT